ncbi:hypothetical protein OCGS_2300 [Oceaniovalibus guishaninsula JLT2003]|uniref:Uncharacterized protein n=1 Tax=Oceaniovalibus guishaninsula JLT2003 TaxID=1231392 RepID=K2H7H4_9RHOB|nr:molybdenum ABC transporter ATP-binding protein [Oceaniovalibus guishaninsula]EKE43568.1 hypothetical protein OCGS_2300 [Oceaniovalibus guishaninsula JLT2003]
MTLEVRLSQRWPGFALDAAFTAPDGVTALFGRSGSGKTTIVNAVAGLLRPQAGRIVLGGDVLLDTRAGRFVPPSARRIGYVFQDGRLFPHMDVAANLLYGRRPRRRDAAFSDVVDLLGIGALLARRPAALSGGEKSRVALGRALLSNPRLLLMDEPLAALDEARKAEILPYLERIRDTARIPILYVSHSVAEIARLATTLVTIEAGRVTGAGPVAAMLADPGAVRFLGVREAGAVLAGRIVAHHPDGLSEVAVSGGSLHLPRIALGVGHGVRLRIAAQDVILSRAAPVGLSALNILPGIVTAIRRGDGPGAMVQLACGGDLLLARITGRSADAMDLREGQPCHAIMKSVAVHPDDVGG